MEDFLQFEAKVKIFSDTVGDVLSRNLSDEPMELIRDLTECEGYNSHAHYLLASANSFLDEARAFYVRSIEGIALEKKVLLDGKCVPFSLVRDHLEGICESIKQKLILGESMLGFFKLRFAEARI